MAFLGIFYYRNRSKFRTVPGGAPPLSSFGHLPLARKITLADRDLVLDLDLIPVTRRSMYGSLKDARKMIEISQVLGK